MRMRGPYKEAHTHAYEAAVGAAKAAARRRWRGQAAWDKDNMETVSCRLPRGEAARLRRCCKEAGLTRYELIAYMVSIFMAGWEAYHGADQ